MSGGDIDDFGVWYGVMYYGGLYLVGFDGTMTLIGSTIPVNSLAFNYANGLWYCTDTVNLYTIDITTGATTTVGPLGTANTLIGLACDKDGNMYGYDVLFSGMSSLYSINTATGAATVIGSMGVGFLYAQDPAYDRDMDILYIAGYTQSGTSGLYTCDVGTGAVTLVGPFTGNCEVDGFAIPWQPIQYPHDISVQGITEPKSQNAAPITPIVKVKNVGLNTEYDVPINLLIGKELITGAVEDFEADNGSYIHAAKNTDNWQWGAPTSGPMGAHSGSNVWATVLNGPYPNNMWTLLMTPEFTVPSGATFNYWQWYQFESGWDGGNVKISTDGGTTFNLITPEGGYPGVLSSNPYMTGQPGFTGTGVTSWNQVNFDLSAYEGMEAIILWEAASDSSVTYAGWYIDDVGFTTTTWVNEYDQTYTIPVINPDQVMNLTFPTWTPADLGSVENTNINYNAEATNQMVPDNNSANDYKSKMFTLHFGYFDDVALTQIVSPVSGLATTQTPEVVLENHGQNDESANVNMVIGKATYTTLLTEDFSSGVPPTGWTTDAPLHWMSSNTNYAGGTAPEAEFYYLNSDTGDFHLYTPAIDTTGWTAALLKYKEDVNDYNGQYTLKIQTSTDFGATWTDAYTRAGGPYGPTTTQVTLGVANGVGSPNLMISWTYSGNAYNINYWYVDDVWFGQVSVSTEYDQTVTVDINAGATMNVVLPDWTPSDVPLANSIDYVVNVQATLNGFTPIWNYGFEEAWIPAVPPGPPEFPPAGWAIWNVNGGGTWIRTTSGMRTGTGAAYVSYNYPAPNNDWLATKGTVVAPGGVFSLWIKGYTYNDDTYNVYMSTVGNTVADFQAGTLLASGIAPSAYALLSFDMSAYVGQTCYYAVQSTGNDAWYVWVDDVTFPDGSFEGFEGGTPGVAGHWPSFVQYTYGTTTDQWLSATTGSYPTCTPPEGTYMAEYNSFSISSGYSAELDGTVLVDFSTATQMKFKMMHDTGYSTSADVIYPLLSADGVNFWYDGTAFYRYDGTTGWKTETMDYSFLISYLGGPGPYYVGFYAVSAYGNNMFIDDLSVSIASDIPDGHPSDNSLAAIITLSYEHDAGVIAITDYPGADKGRDIIWDNYADDGTGAGLSSQLDEVYPFNSQCADDFQFAEAMDVTGVHYWGQFWNGVTYPNPGEFNIIFYADDGSGTMPTGAGMTNPETTALAIYNFPAVTGVSYGTNKYEYDVTIDPAFVADAGVKYWVVCQEVASFAASGQWGWSTNGANPEQLSGPVQGFPQLSPPVPFWTPTTYGDHAFQLSGETHSGGGGGNPPPGTYGIAGVIKNLGVTYSESDIPVNAQITNATNVVVYDETIVIAGPLAPGHTATVVFPDITIENVTSAEGTYKLTMQTMLVGDDHPNNDKKTQTFTIQKPDTMAPITTASLSGTMGQNNWYVSAVTVTLSAIDPPEPRYARGDASKWPTGVNHTYYKLDAADWVEYTTPFQVTADGEHTVQYYSVDKWIPPNVETTKSINFKIDRTAPTVSLEVTRISLILHNKWNFTATVSDPASGVVKVEFYVDDVYVGNATAAPWSYIYKGFGQVAQAIAYDAAGNSAMSEPKDNFDSDQYIPNEMNGQMNNQVVYNLG
jgi:hypothetical protein